MAVSSIWISWCSATWPEGRVSVVGSTSTISVPSSKSPSRHAVASSNGSWVRPRSTNSQDAPLGQSAVWTTRNVVRVSRPSRRRIHTV